MSNLRTFLGAGNADRFYRDKQFFTQQEGKSYFTLASGVPCLTGETEVILNGADLKEGLHFSISNAGVKLTRNLNLRDELEIRALASYEVTTLKPGVGENLLINGCMSVAQRNYDPQMISGFCHADRWRINRCEKVGTSIFEDTHVPASHYLWFKPSIGQTSRRLCQWIENGATWMGGQVVTLSFYMYAQTGDPTTALSNFELLSVNTVEATGTFSFEETGLDKIYRVTSTVTVPHVSGGLDSMEIKHMDCWINFANGAAGDAFEGWISAVKLEIGSTATPFVQDPLQVNLAKCLRYFYKSPNSFYINGSVSHLANQPYWSTITFPVPMRSTPIIKHTNVSKENSQAGGITYANTHGYYYGSRNINPGASYERWMLIADAEI